MLLLTVLILSSEEAAVVTPLGEFAISSALMNISRKYQDVVFPLVLKVLQQ